MFACITAMFCASLIICIITSYCMVLPAQSLPPPSGQEVSETTIANASLNLNRPSYRDLSAMAFRSLFSSDYEDSPLQSSAIFQQWTEGRRHRKRPRDHKKKRNKKKQRQKERRLRLQQQQHGTLDSLKTVYPRKPQTYVVANRDMIGVEHCRTIAFKQRIRLDGCISKTVVNNICHGQCNSFFIPRLHSNKLRALFESYSVCRPTQVTTVTVHLQCPARPTPLVRRKYFKVKECSCMSAREPPSPSFAAA